MLIEYWVCKVQTQQLPQVQSGRGCAEAGHRDWQRGFISSGRRCKLLPNPTAKSCSSLHGENWQMRFPLTSEPTESGSNIASVCYPRSFISFQLIKLFCGSPAHMPLSWSRTRCSFSSFAIRPLGTPKLIMKVEKDYKVRADHVLLRMPIWHCTVCNNTMTLNKYFVMLLHYV